MINNKLNTKGQYINNKGIQKTTQKFLNYFINSIEKKKEELKDKKINIIQFLIILIDLLVVLLIQKNQLLTEKF